jgi:hypothetical protein
MISVRVLLLLASTLFVIVSISTAQEPSKKSVGISVPQFDKVGRLQIAEKYGKLPLSFEGNRGQADARVRFLSRGTGYTLFLTNDEAIFELHDGNLATDSSVVGHSTILKTVPPKAGLRMKLLDAKLGAKVTGVDELPGKSNYFIGNDPRKWHNNVPTYAKVKYEGVYSGIDLIYYGTQHQLEYDFVVAPGADPRQIQFDVQGARGIHRDKNGDLMFKLKQGEVRWRKPVIYQKKDGARQLVDGNYVIHQHQVGFEVAAYDKERTLVIDPTLVYSTYLGGSGGDVGYGITVDNSGNAYVTGFTGSSDFPTLNPLQGQGGNGDVFVTKLNATGSALVYSTYIGGNGSDTGFAIAVDSSGNAYVAGGTSSNNFPTVNPLQSTYGGGSSDAFLAELNASGSALIYSTYIGGSLADQGEGVAVDAAGNASVTGFTSSTNFPTVNPFQAANSGGVDAFVAKVKPAGTLAYSSYLGGSGTDVGIGIAVDGSGDAYIVGSTSSTDFPIINPVQPFNAGGMEDAFVTEINSSGSALVYSTYLGGSDLDVGVGIAADTSGAAYVTGYTLSTDFPTKNPFQPANGGNSDAFIAKLHPLGSGLIYSTYLGGINADTASSIAVDGSGSVYIVGSTNSTNFPTVNPVQPFIGGGQDDAFVTELNSSGSALTYSSYLGGSDTDNGSSIAVDTAGNIYITGQTFSSDFPTKNSLQPVYGGSSDAFVAKINTIPSAAATFVPQSLDFGNEPISVSSKPLKTTLTNTGSVKLKVTSIGVIGTNKDDFEQTNNCNTVAPGRGCSITVTYTPTAAGARTAALSITDNAANSPQSVPLSGFAGGSPIVTLGATAAIFNTQPVNTAGPIQKVTLANTGTANLNISRFTVTGDFAQTNNCGNQVKNGGQLHDLDRFSTKDGRFQRRDAND